MGLLRWGLLKGMGSSSMGSSLEILGSIQEKSPDDAGVIFGWGLPLGFPLRVFFLLGSLVSSLYQ